MKQPIRSPDECWTRGEALAFVIRVGDVPFVFQQMRYEGVDGEGRCVFRYYWETHWERIGGGAKASAAALLKTDRWFRPVAYELFSDRHSLRLASFFQQRADLALADKSTVTLALEQFPDLVFQHNVILQPAAWISLVPAGSHRTALAYFSPDSLSVQSLGLETAGDGRWRTSLGVEILCDERNRIRAIRAPKANLTGEVVSDLVEEPPWEDLRKVKSSAYRPPDGVRVEEFAIGGSRVDLGAALSLPADREGRGLPAFLYLQGSGRLDRHGMASGMDTGVHQIADFLSCDGYAGLRYDARGAGTTGFGEVFESHWQARLEDARRALAALLNRPEVDRRRFYLIGHSLGALTALQLASEVEPPPAGVVLLACPGRRIDRVILEQSLRESRRLRFSQEQQRERTRLLRETFRRLSDEAAISQAGPEVQGLTRAFLRELLTIDPLALVRSVNVPVLICQGAKDIQISVRRDALRLFEAAVGGGVQCELHVFARSDHLFKEETGEPSPTRYFIDRPVDAAFTRSLLGWLNDVALRPEYYAR